MKFVFGHFFLDTLKRKHEFLLCEEQQMRRLTIVRLNLFPSLSKVLQTMQNDSKRLWHALKLSDNRNSLQSQTYVILHNIDP